MNFEIISKWLKPDPIIDIGANVGHWHKEAKAYWPDAKFFLIEGNPSCQPALNDLGVSYAIAMLSDTEKEATFYTRKDAPTCTGASLYREQTEFYEGDKAIETKVKTVTLDSLFPCPVGPRTLIKIDCQGSELDILKGGERTIEGCSGLIIEHSLVEYNKGAPLLWHVDKWLIDRNWNYREKLGDIVHPITREIIQQDWFYPRPSE